MSKLYKQYVLLKINNPNKIYLFKCGIFYIFIDDDAKIMANILDLKLVPLNSVIMKCGFPVKSANKYFNILKSSDYQIEIIPSIQLAPSVNINTYIMNQKFNNIIFNFINTDISSLSIKEAFELLVDLQNKFKQTNSEMNLL